MDMPYDRINKLICCLLTGVILFAWLIAPQRPLARPINSDQAKSAVETFLKTRFPADKKPITGAPGLTIAEVAPLSYNSKTVGYITTLEPSGYALVRADDEVPTMKIYSENGTFDNLPPGFLTVIKLELAEELQNLNALKQSGTHFTSKFQEQWTELLNPVDQNTLTSPPTSAPNVILLNTVWNQNDPYNLYSPTASGGPDGRAWAGCTATALAQILRYHSAPSQVSQDHTYTDNWGSCTGSHSISDAGMDAYDWANMPTSVNPSSPLTEQQAIGQLIHHAGVALESDFEATGTLAAVQYIPNILMTFFDYTSGSSKNKSEFTSSQWYSKISTDIDAGRPILYSMWDANGQSGHAVVLDGYRNGNEIHLNLGWSGSGNLWYNIDTVSYGSYTWTRHVAIFDILPQALPDPVIVEEPPITPGRENTIYWNDISATAGSIVDTGDNEQPVEYYAVYSYTPDFRPFSSSQCGWITWTYCTFKGLTPGQTYWYRVKARRGTDESSWSNVVYSQQAPPSYTVTAIGAGNGSGTITGNLSGDVISASWEANTLIGDNSALVYVGSGPYSINANADVGSKVSWTSGCDTIIGNGTVSATCTLNAPISSNKNITATYECTGIYYLDSDGDGFGDSNNSIIACELPIGYVNNNTDCDDTDAEEYPRQTWYADTDSDTYGNPLSTNSCERADNSDVLNGNDCDDSDTTEHPGVTWYADADSDTYGNASSFNACERAGVSDVLDNTDCDDSNASIFPGASDANCDGIDNDCLNGTDDGYENIPTICGVGACSAAGYLECQNGSTINTCEPKTPIVETCGDGIDQDCDGNDLMCPDSDADGISDDIDNCINIYNPDQKDYDNDGIGNACESCEDFFVIPNPGGGGAVICL